MSVGFSWDDDDFEASVSAGIIACHESKIRKVKMPSNLRIKDEDLSFMRRIGLFFPGNDRITIYDENNPCFDVVNDPLPTHGCLALRNIGNVGIKNPYIGYVYIVLFKQVNSLPKDFIARTAGTHYEMSLIVPDGDRISGEKHFVSVSKTGNVLTADQIVMCNTLGVGRPHKAIKQSEHEPEILTQRQILMSMVLQMVADKRFCWSINAKQNIGNVNIGCTKEEIKSLLYARSLPITESGRKRPIAHLVEAHKRRLKNGIEIDVTPFIKGVQIVDIHGTAFTVNPPKVIKPVVSLNSQVRYFKEEA